MSAFTERGASSSSLNLMNSSTRLPEGAAMQKPRTGKVLSAEKPADRTLPVRGFCIAAPSGNRVDEFIKFIEEELAPRSVNALILRVDYNFQFLSRPEIADKGGLSKEQAQKI